MPTEKYPWATQAGDWLRLPGHDLATAYRNLISVARPIQVEHADRIEREREIREERALLGLPSHPEKERADSRDPLLSVALLNDATAWTVGPIADAAARDALVRAGSTVVQRPDRGVAEPWMTWTVPVDGTIESPGTALAARVDRCLDTLVERAARTGALGPEYSRPAISEWACSPSGRRSLDRARRLIKDLLARTKRLPSDEPRLAIVRGGHIPRRELSQRLAITPIVHEGRTDRHGDWGGPRRILAQSQDRTRRVFIAEGHKRVRIGKARSTYTPSSLWIQGDTAEGLFGRDTVIYQGRVSSDVLAEFGERIERGLSCPGLSGFLSVLHTVTFDDGP